MQKLFLTLTILVLTACAPMVWNKPGASAQEYAVDSFECTEQAQQRYAAAELSVYGGELRDRPTNDNGLFAACLNAKGWHLGPQQEVVGNARNLRLQEDQFTPTALRDTFTLILADQQALCARPEFAALYRRSACQVGDLTIAQLADTGVLGAADKSTFSQLRKEGQEIGRRAAAAYRAFGGEPGRLTATAIDRAEALSEKNALELYSGRMGWGEFNQRRRDNHVLYRNDFKRIHGQK